MKKARSLERAFFFVLCLQVVLGDLAPVVHPDSRAHHTDNERGGEPYGRTKSPTRVAASCSADEREELSHTQWTNAGRDWHSMLQRGVFGVQPGPHPGREQKIHQSEERELHP